MLVERQCVIYRFSARSALCGVDVTITTVKLRIESPASISTSESDPGLYAVLGVYPGLACIITC